MPQGAAAIEATPAVTQSRENGSVVLRRMIRGGLSFSGRERNCCFLNTRTPRFADVSAVSGLDFPDDARGVARVDWDLDGDVDLWINNRTGPQVRFLLSAVPSRNRFLALRLEGRTCNRDAIGARVEVRLQGRRVPLLQTLRAGDGFLAQSTKWIHFGLGAAERIESLVIRWPGGDREAFAGAEVNGRYRLVQGSGRAERWAGGARSVRLEPSGSEPRGELPSSESAVRTFSAARVPLPRLSYETFGGERRLLAVDGAPRARRPLLLNLWASWCAPCVNELGEFTREAESVRQAGVDILALSVDGLDNGKPEIRAARALIEKLGFPFDSGMATVELLDKLRIVNNELFDLHESLPVPTSVLIDPAFRLAAIYKGAVRHDQFLADARQLTLEGEALRRASLPFDGRWLSDPRELRLMPLVWELLVKGFVEDALEYAARVDSRLRTDPEFATLLARMGYELLERDQLDAAAERYRAALTVAPGFTVARLNLAVALIKQGKPRDALAQYHEALRYGPEDVRVHSSIAMLLASCPDEEVRDGGQAVEWAERAALATAQREPGALDALGAAYAETGRFPEAIAAARKTLELARARGQDQFAEDVESRLRLYEQGQPYRALP